jgi:BirA family transcriptional regulator, biotin operon repressor / biotin---[acetyl-CoA-carboxylase] ligase
LCSHLDRHYQQYLSEGSAPAFEMYNRNLYKKGQTVNLKKENITFSCTIEGVNPSGDLLVRDCNWDHFTFGEVEWIR